MNIIFDFLNFFYCRWERGLHSPHPLETTILSALSPLVLVKEGGQRRALLSKLLYDITGITLSGRTCKIIKGNKMNYRQLECCQESLI